MPKNMKKLSKGNEAARLYNKKMVAVLNEDADAIFARVNKVLCSDRFVVHFYDKAKKQTTEVQAAAVDKKVKRMKVNLGDYVVVATSGKTYEVAILLSAKQVQDYVSQGRIHRSIADSSPENAAGVEFDYSEEEEEEVDIDKV
jgi:translation initiation factor IF-1